MKIIKLTDEQYAMLIKRAKQDLRSMELSTKRFMLDKDCLTSYQSLVDTLEKSE